jgi:hypothetical protein
MSAGGTDHPQTPTEPADDLGDAAEDARLDAAEHEEESRRRERYGLLLTAIVASFALQGIAQPGPVEEVIVTVLLAVTLLLALWAADVRPQIMRPAILLAGLIVLACIADASVGSTENLAYRAANLLLVVLAPPAIVIGVSRSMQKRHAVTVEAVFGVLCLYILLGMFFAFVYGAIAHVQGGEFFAAGQKANTANCLYFSFTTLTTVGYGDFTAAANLGHTLSVTEGLIGQIYLVTVVSVIVGNLALGQQRRERRRRRRR